jgi:dGTPase
MIRIILEKQEKEFLSSYAKLSSQSVGRQKEEKESDYLTCFQSDRKRIIYSKAFRRLKHKTQVFLEPEGDHYRTRLIHTVEVSEISRTIARCLSLNEDLAEAIALGHDLGHTPFGHAGEVILNKLSKNGFKHNEQSLRIVDVLEGNDGLNLTNEVRDGILNHTGENIPSTLEGQIVRIADRIAYINHDIDDAIRGGIIKEQDLPNECIKILGNNSQMRIENMIMDIVSKSTNCIRMSSVFQNAQDELRNFLFDKVYVNSIAKKDEQKAQDIIEKLFMYFRKNLNSIPTEISKKYDAHKDELVADYIAGMTDRYAINKFKEIFIPKSGW